MKIEFLPHARSELLDAVAYYEDDLRGLGERFWREVETHIAWIADVRLIDGQIKGRLRYLRS